MPPKAAFDRDAILAASSKVVREQGWEQLSARTIAREMQSSTRPVYTGFSSMQEIRDALGRQVYTLLLDYMFRPVTGNPFLDTGVGYVLFARNEPAMFRLFYLPHIISFDLEQELQEQIDGRLMDQMQQTKEAPQISARGAKSMLQRLKIFTHGLACYTTGDKYPYNETEIIKLIKDAGRAFFHDELALDHADTTKGDECR